MTGTYKIGDIVKPKPNYERCATVCGQCCKHKTEKSWLYHFFNAGIVSFVHEDGSVDIAVSGGNMLYRIQPEMLEKAQIRKGTL